MKIHPISLANKLTLWYAAIFILCFGAIFGTFYAIMHNNFYVWTDAELEEELFELYEAYEKNGIPGVIEQMKHEELTERGEYFGRIIGTQGKVVFETTDLQGGHVQVNKASLEKILHGIKEVETIHFTDRHHARITYGTLPDGSIVQVGVALRNYEVWMQQFSRTMLAAAFFVFVLAVVASIFIARRSLAPIEAVASLASEISGHSTGRRIPITGQGKEVNQLARSFNAMLDRIDTLLKGLREATESLAHDMRTPITSMRGMADVILSADRTADEYRLTLYEIMEQLDGLLGLFNTILDVAEAESGALELRRESVRIDLLGERVMQTFEPVAINKGISLEARITPDLVIKGDQPRLTQVLVNLIDNALKYTPAGGYVQLTIAPDADGKGITIIVTDKGVGISDIDLPHIFERYYRSDKSRSGSGFGLGLPLVKGIVESHGGSVAAATLPSGGASFKVLLPTDHNLS
jgi:heavy metal sensor kinase